jgi:hypothetical protein
MNDIPPRGDEAPSEVAPDPISDPSVPARPSIPVAPITPVLVRLVDGRPPFPQLARYRLLAVPRPGDGIFIEVDGRRSPYRVSFVNFDPFNDINHITISCLPNDTRGAGGVNDANLKEKMDEYIETQHRFFERAEAYSKAILVAGYAGVFAIWGFARDVLSARATEWSAVLVGISLLLYITWEIAQMVSGTLRRYRFNLLVNNDPRDFFKTLANHKATERSMLIRDNRNWLIVLIPTVVFGYAGACVLLWNVAAKLIGSP